MHTWQREYVHTWDESGCGRKEGGREGDREGRGWGDGKREEGWEGDSLELETESFFFSHPRLQFLLVFALLFFSKVN